ncbi:hypothetical protein DFH08DRAFT_1001894 [Mycena albidolilacea]|uniref:CBM1 domain-containing protein n=1 Tax=Mycena albidolilacea TaxID=1033008 RepID=A0AAD7A1V8_9AGAR|nr:hypothetical protein DFH08DRAFT_1001894 [Mycena albidolilacea]
MLFIQLAFLALSASAALVHLARDVNPAIATLKAITDELEAIDLDLKSFNSSSNTSLAFVIDGTFEAIHVVTLDASLQVYACVAQNGVADDDDTEYVINLANATYVPTLLDVLKRTIAAKPTFAGDSLPSLVLVSRILQDLKRYNGSNTLYLNNLTAAVSFRYLPTVKNLTGGIALAFDQAIDAYSCPGPECTSTTTITTSTSTRSSPITSTTATSTTSSPPSSTLPATAFGQCGGLGWTGPTTCVAGYRNFKCIIGNPVAACISGRPRNVPFPIFLLLPSVEG